MIIDIFNHFMPPRYFERARGLAPDHAAATAFPRLKTLWDVEARLRLMEQFGDFQQVLSLANPPLAGRRHLAREQICERAAGLEGAGVLEQLQLDIELARAETDIRPIHLNDWRAPYVMPNELLTSSDLLAVDRNGLTWLPQEFAHSTSAFG
jgi:hypothetical protein